MHDVEVEEGRGVIRSVKIDNKQKWEKHHVPPTEDGVAKCFLIRLQSVVQFSFRSSFF